MMVLFLVTQLKLVYLYILSQKVKGLTIIILQLCLKVQDMLVTCHNCHLCLYTDHILPLSISIGIISKIANAVQLKTQMLDENFYLDTQQIYNLPAQ